MKGREPDDWAYSVATDTAGNMIVTGVSFDGITENYYTIKYGEVVIPDTTPPASITNLQSLTGETWIRWSWDNPHDSDFNHTIVYLDGVRKTNTSATFYNATNLVPDTTHEIGTHTVDNVGNINTTWVNQTARTKTTLPAPTPTPAPPRGGGGGGGGGGGPADTDGDGIWDRYCCIVTFRKGLAGVR